MDIEGQGWELGAIRPQGHSEIARMDGRRQCVCPCHAGELSAGEPPTKAEDLDDYSRLLMHGYLRFAAPA